MMEHLQHMEQVFSVLQQANFRLNVEKCELVQKKIKFLGHFISEEGIAPSPEKVHAITAIPEPTTIKAAVSFIKMAEYYRNHVKNFSTIAQPLFDLTRKNAVFQWNDEHRKSFELIKELLSTQPLLKYPDSELPFIIQVDASNYGIGGVLMQNFKQGEQPIAYISQKLNKQQKNWNATEKECYAVVVAIRKWNHYVDGREFVVRTDHHALCWLNRKFNNNPKLNRWRMGLQAYTFKIEHIKGKRNCVADCLSRYPVNSPHDDDDDLTEQRSQFTQTEAQPPIVGAVSTRQRTYQSTSTTTSATTPTTTLTPGPTTTPTTTLIPGPTAPALTNKPVHQTNPSNRINEITIFTNNQLQQYQQQDTSISKIIENIDRRPFSQEYCIINGMLHRKLNRFNGIIKVPVVPRQKINDILLAYHNSSFNGAHFGKDRTYYKIRDRYYWTNMYRDIVEHVRSCSSCAMNKCSRRKPDGYLNSADPPEGVWQNLAMDFVGPITPPSSSGNKYILVITDLLSKFVVAKPTRDNSAVSAAKVLVEDVILKYGSPNQLLTDNGTHFSAELFNSITSLYGICHVFTTPYNPKANGVCERFNSSMCDTLASMSNNKKTDWDQQLSKLIFAYNTSRHVSTKLTPYEMMFGRLCKLPFDLPKQTTTTIEPHQYVKQVYQYLELAKEIVHAKILEDQKKSKQRYDTNRTNENYSIGDFVYVKRLGLYNKLTTKFYGPYQIIQKLNESVYRIQNPNDLNEIINVHLNRLRRWYAPPNPTRTN